MDYLYAELIDNIINLDYNGSTTTTATTNIDNNTRTISVDVLKLPYSLTLNIGSSSVIFDGSEDKVFTVDLSNYYTKEEVNNLLSSKQDSLPTIINDRYLHTNASTGSLEWSEVQQGHDAIWGSITGTLSNQTDLQNALNAKQDTLVSGSNIKTINGNSILGSGNIATKSYQTFGSNWTTSGTTADFCTSIVEDSSATAGMCYLGQLNCSDLPASLVQGEATVEVLTDNANGKAITITLTSVDTSPYRWTYSRAKVNGSYVATEWKAYELDITSSNKLSADLVDDTSTTNKFVTSEEKNTWNNKQDQIKTKEPVWVNKVWYGLTNINASRVWTDGENIYYSDGWNHYVLDVTTSTWSSKTWNGFTNFSGANIWTDGANIYYSGSTNQYVLDIATSTWSEKIWTGLTKFYGDEVWTDGTNIYYSSSTNHYVLDVSTSTWSTKTWNGKSNFYGAQIWTDGTNIYYSYGEDQYVLNKNTSTWSRKRWNSFTNLNGANIWTDDTNIYYSYNSQQYVLDKETSTWNEKTWNGLTNFIGNNIWTDGNNIYYSYNDTHYILTTEDIIPELASSFNETDLNRKIPSASLVKDVLDSKQDSLPTIVNNKYLHTNSSTGDLEWSDVNGIEVVTAATSSGTFSDSDFAKVIGDNCVIKCYDIYYTKYKDLSEVIYYVPRETTEDENRLWRTHFIVNKYTKKFNTVSFGLINKVELHQDTSDTNIELLGIKIGSSSFKVSKMTETTWSELKTKRDNSQLIPGMQYRITDYVTKSTQTDTLSAEHQFDIIVTADSPNKLNEIARAIQHSGDTYFANNNLSGWQIWYCLDNDNVRFAWASGKCIYTQEGRTLNYFYRNPRWDVSSSKPYPFAWGHVQDGLVWTIIYTNTENPTTETKAYSSYSGGQYATEYTIIDVPEESGKGVIYKMIDEFNNEAPYDFKNILYKISNVKNVYTFNKTSSGLIDGSLNLEENNGHTIQSIKCKYNRIKPYYSGGTSFLNWVYLSGESFNNYFEYGSYHCHFGNRIEDTYCSGHHIETGDNILKCNLNGSFIYVGDWIISNELSGSYIYVGNYSSQCHLKGYYTVLGTGRPLTADVIVTIDYTQNIVSESSLSNINIVATTSTNDYLQNITLHSGLSNKTITVDRGLSYTTNVYPVGSTDIFA